MLSGLSEGDTVVAGPYQRIRQLVDGDRIIATDEPDSRRLGSPHEPVGGRHAGVPADPDAEAEELLLGPGRDPGRDVPHHRRHGRRGPRPLRTRGLLLPDLRREHGDARAVAGDHHQHDRRAAQGAPATAVSEIRRRGRDPRAPFPPGPGRGREHHRGHARSGTTGVPSTRYRSSGRPPRSSPSETSGSPREGPSPTRRRSPARPSSSSVHRRPTSSSRTGWPWAGWCESAAFPTGSSASWRSVDPCSGSRWTT